MTHTTKTPAQLRAEIKALQAALAAMEAVDPLLIEAREICAADAETIRLLTDAPVREPTPC